VSYIIVRIDSAAAGRSLLLFYINLYLRREPEFIEESPTEILTQGGTLDSSFVI
jgi:hypothetical protein